MEDAGGLIGFVVVIGIIVAVIYFVAQRAGGGGESPSDLPMTLQKGFQSFSEEDKMTFWLQYKKKRRGLVPMLLLAVFFPIQLFFLGKLGLGIAFWLTGGGFGIWYVIEWFVTPKRVRDYNEEIALQIGRDLKLFAS